MKIGSMKNIFFILFTLLAINNFGQSPPCSCCTSANINSSGNIVINRIKWTPNDDGTVRQLWEGSKDGGQNWSIIFDGNYVRKG